MNVLSGLNRAINLIKVENNYYDKDLSVKYDQSSKPDIISQLNRLPTSVLFLGAVVVLVLAIGLMGVSVNRARSLKTIQKLLYWDQLTGLYNKRGFEKRISEILHQGKAEGKYAIVALDIDNFHLYNEFNGIAAGDAILRAVADTAREEIGGDEISARFAADDFVFLLRAADNNEVSAKLKRGDDHFHIHIDNQFVRINYGVYLIDDNSTPIQFMYDRAVFALKTIIAENSFPVAFYDSDLYEEQKENSEILFGAENAFHKKEFAAYYQPKFDAENEKIVGAEALVRWIKSDGTVVSPDKFIALFERQGLITKLDFYVFEAVCRDIAKERGKGLPIVPISVNFSRAHLFNLNFADEIKKIAMRYMVPTEMLEVEITESAFVLESKILSDMVESLHSHGFKVAIDDFGSGYSSLGILKDIDADVLKMDMKFLEGFEKGGRVGTIVLAMMRMAKWLKLNVVVEGVETKEQADFIKSIGGEMIQGYYYSKPLPLEDWERLLDGRQVTKKEEPFDGFSAEDTAILMGGNRLINRLLGGLCSGFGLYEYVEGRLSILRVNDGYRAIMHSGNSDISLYAGNVLDRVEERDRGAFLKNLEKAIDTGEAVDVRFHRINDKGELIYIEGIILRLNDDIKAPILCISFHDIYDKKSYDSSGKSVTDNP